MRLDPINHCAAWLVTGLRGRLFVSLLGYWRDTGGILAVSGIIFKCSPRSTYDRRACGENIVSLLQVFESVICCVILLI